MAAPAPNNPLVCKATLIFQKDTRVLNNVLHFSKSTPWNLSEMQDLAADLVGWYTNSYKLVVPVQISLKQIQVRLYDPSNPLAYDQAVSPPIAGLRPGSGSPLNATLTASLRTGLAGRRFRGRFYLPGVQEPDQGEDDRIGSTVVNQLASAAVGLFAGQITGGVLGIFHAPKEVPSAFDNTITNVISTVVEDIIDSQRRRLPGRGR